MIASQILISIQSRRRRMADAANGDKDVTTNLPSVEKQYRVSLTRMSGGLVVSFKRSFFWSTNDNLNVLLRYRPSIEDMHLILRANVLPKSDSGAS
ncbi:MAG: hypothetical protein ACRD8Z_08720 [Nitrososphaeraceae archaeon]